MKTKSKVRINIDEKVDKEITRVSMNLGTLSPSLMKKNPPKGKGTSIRKIKIRSKVIK